MTGPRRLVRSERGQAAVELALSFPLVIVALLAVAQVVLVARDQLAVVHAAREAARAAAVASDPGVDGGAAGRSASGLDDGRLEVGIAVDGERVRATVTYRSATIVPVVGALIGDVTVRAEAVMQREPP